MVATSRSRREPPEVRMGSLGPGRNQSATARTLAYPDYTVTQAFALWRVLVKITIRRFTVMLFVPVFVLLAPAAVFGQTAVITGIVRDTDGEPIEGATVDAESAQHPASPKDQTNSEGRFAFIGLQSGRWLFSIGKVGYRSAQGFANVRRSGRVGMSFVLEPDPFNPEAPSTGLLAGLRAAEIQTALDAAHTLFDGGDYQAAIDRYEALLERIPKLTSLNLQIGHAYREQRDYPRALTAYRAVPADSAAATEAAAAIQALETDDR